MTRPFVLYAAATLIPVLVLGVVLARSFRGEAHRRGLAEGRAQARLIAETAVSPWLSGRSLTAGLSLSERAVLGRLTRLVIARGDVLRLRIQDQRAHVVFSGDGSGLGGTPDDDALNAARGAVVARLTRLNADSNDTGRAGTESVEVYEPLSAGSPSHRVGVLELYVPYAPISRDISAGLHRLYLELAAGLAALYLVLFGITVSVTRGLRREAAINAFLAEHDVLTELPNRTQFHRRAVTAIRAAEAAGRSVALAIVDLDRFKEINDTLGHHSGDQLLSEIARRLAAQMRPGDTVARLGGDEFGIIVRDLARPEPALWRALEVIDREVEVSGLPLSVQASLGYVLAPYDGSDVDELLQRADVAMYAAKAQHGGLLRYDPSLDHYDAASLALVSQLRKAIDDDELVLHYQPQVQPGEGRVRAFEALVRWQHPEHGLLYPDRFLPLAEQTDVIDKLTSWVLRTALLDLRRLAGEDDELCMAVNVSARSIGRERFAVEVLAVLEELEMPGRRLVVEVTETALMADPDRAGAVLTRLADAGVGVSLDDFGRGQTSLGYLSALPLEELKIDRSFVTDMLEDDAHAAIVRSIIDLGHNLDLRVVAEGVEAAATMSALQCARCDLAQGYLLAHPMPLEVAVRWLDAHARSASPA